MSDYPGAPISPDPDENDDLEGAINAEQQAEDYRRFRERTAYNLNSNLPPNAIPDSIEEQQFGAQQSAPQNAPQNAPQYAPLPYAPQNMPLPNAPDPAFRPDGSVDLGPYRQPELPPIQFTPASKSEDLRRKAQREDRNEGLLRNVASIFAVNRRLAFGLIGCVGIALVIGICVILTFVLRLFTGG